MSYESALNACRIERIKYEFAKSSFKALHSTHNKTNHEYEDAKRNYLSALSKFEKCMINAMDDRDYYE